MGWKWRN
ncbi:hypothetical protein SOVF_047590, partial [Spinacia oleracea]